MKHCLIVDDSRVIRTVARRILEELHFTVDEAEDGMPALRACREQMPDLIFLDWNMPSMKGVEFVKSLRAQPDGARPMILFCTTENDAGEIAQAVAAGANDYVMKPFDREALCAKLAEHRRRDAERLHDAGRFRISLPVCLRRRCRPGAEPDAHGADRAPPGAGDAPLRLQGTGRLLRELRLGRESPGRGGDRGDDHQ